MQLGFYVLAVIVALVLQTHVVFHGVSVVWHVDLALLVMVSGCLQWQARRALLFGFITGLVYDALSSDIMGLNAVSKAVVAYVAWWFSRHVQSHNLILQSGFAALATALDTTTRLFMRTRSWGGVREWDLVKPGEIGLTSTERAAERIH